MMTRSVIKVTLGRVEITFYHKWEIQTGGNRKCNLKRFFQVHFQYQNNSRNLRNSRTIEHPETLCMELHASPSFFFSPPTKGSPSHFGNSPLRPSPPSPPHPPSPNPPTPIKPNFPTLPVLVLVGSHYVCL